MKTTLAKAVLLLLLILFILITPITKAAPAITIYNNSISSNAYPHQDVNARQLPESYIGVAVQFMILMVFGIIYSLYKERG